MHEDVADRLARHEQPAGADQRQPRHPLGMPHRELGGDPAADAMADEIEARQPERVEQFEIVEDDVVDGAGVELVRAVAAGMRGRDHAGVLRQPLMERHEVAGDAVHVGEAVQIDERRAAAGLGDGPCGRGRRRFLTVTCAGSELGAV